MIKINQAFFIFNTKELSVDRIDLQASILVGQIPLLDCAPPRQLTIYNEG